MPMSLFRLPAVASVGAVDARQAATSSFSVVLPLLPVMPTTRTFLLAARPHRIARVPLGIINLDLRNSASTFSLTTAPAAPLVAACRRNRGRRNSGPAARRKVRRPQRSRIGADAANGDRCRARLPCMDSAASDSEPIMLPAPCRCRCGCDASRKMAGVRHRSPGSSHGPCRRSIRRPLARIRDRPCNRRGAILDHSCRDRPSSPPRMSSIICLGIFAARIVCRDDDPVRETLGHARPSAGVCPRRDRRRSRTRTTACRRSAAASAAAPIRWRRACAHSQRRLQPARRDALHAPRRCFTAAVHRRLFKSTLAEQVGENQRRICNIEITRQRQAEIALRPRSSKLILEPCSLAADRSKDVRAPFAIDRSIRRHAYDLLPATLCEFTAEIRIDIDDLPCRIGAGTDAALASK